MYTFPIVPDAHKRTMAELAKSQARLAGIVGSVTDAVVTIDSSEHITLFNAAAERMFGYNADMVLGQPLEMLLPERYRARHHGFIQQFAATGVSNRSMGGLTALSALRANGVEFPIEASISQVEVGDEKLFTVILRDITARQQAEKALADSQARLMGIVSSAMDAIITVDASQHITLFNNAAERMFGYRAEVLLGQPLTLLIPERFRNSHSAHIENFGRTGVTNRGMGSMNALSARRANGEEFPIEASISQVEVEGSKVFTVILRDISERRRAEEALRESQAKYKQIVETSLEGIWVVNEHHNTTYVNPRMAEMLGYTVDEMQGMHLSACVFAEDFGTAQQQMAAQRARGVLDQIDVRFKRKDDSALYCMVAANSIHDDAGNYIGSLAMCADVTERRLAEEQLRESQAFLEEAQAIAKMGNWSIDLEKSLISASKETYRTLGFEPDGPTMDLGEAMQVLHPDDSESVTAALNSAITNGTLFECDYRVVWPDASVHWIHSRGQVLLDATGQPREMRGINQDITQRKSLEEQQAKLENQLRQSQKMEAIGTLAGGIAHDFNNILYAIQGFGEMVRETLVPGSQAWDDQQEVLDAAARAGDLVRQILTFCRRTQTNRVAVGLPTVIREIGKLMRASLPSTIEVQILLDSHEATVIADPIELHQVLMNLCTNAGHAMGEDGGLLEIRLREFELEEAALHSPGGLPPGRYHLISVSDTGSGIEPEVLERIFEPFFTTKEVGKGTGLGLSIVHGVVTDLGGTVTVYSRLGQGTNFHIYLPCSEETVEQTASAQAQGGSESVLFIDDEAALARMGKQSLEKLGYRVETCTNGIEALALFRQRPQDFDIIVTDETMPQLRGSELVVQLAEVRSDIPVIICTGYSRNLEGPALHPMVRAVLLKPVTRAQLTAAIREALDTPKP